MPAPADDLDLTGVEVVIVAVLSALAAAILPAYLLYRANLTIPPFAMLPLAVLALAACLVRMGRRAAWSAAESLAAGAILVAVSGWLMWCARPDLMPTGGGPDLTHHVVLIDYLADHWRQAGDPRVVYELGEMTHYTPGSHLLIALVAAWARVPVLSVIHPVLVVTVALKSVVVFLIARRLVRQDRRRVPVAVTAALLLFLPLDYFIGSFTHDSFWAQVAAELFACWMWWAILVWDAKPSRTVMAMAGVAGAATFVTWPIWTGPLAVTLFAIVAPRSGLSLRERLIQLLIGLGPLASAAVIHAAGQLGWAMIAGTSGAVLRPSPGTLGWTFLTLSSAGVIVMTARREGRTTIVLIAAIAVQAAALFVFARTHGADTPYMSYKMMYLVIYPLAVAGAVALDELARQLERTVGGAGRWPIDPSWVFAALAGVFAITQVIAAPRPHPTMSRPVHEAGLWARAHVEPSCVDYLGGNGFTAYWLHFAVLGNSRTAARAADNETFEPKSALIRWIQPDGLPYAVAVDFDALPKDIRSHVDVLQRFGPAAVIKRQGRSTCP